MHSIWIQITTHSKIILFGKKEVSWFTSHINSLPFSLWHCLIQGHAGAAEWPVYENASDCNKFQSLQQGEKKKTSFK